MSSLFKKLLKKKSFHPKREATLVEIPPPKLIESAQLFDYLEHTPTIDKVQREYMFALMRFKNTKDELKKLEDEQFEAVLSGKVTADDSFNFTKEYEDLQERLRYLDRQRKNLKQRAKEVKRPAFPVQRTAVHYPPI